jgi:hypothetical protein
VQPLCGFQFRQLCSQGCPQELLPDASPRCLAAVQPVEVSTRYDDVCMQQSGFSSPSEYLNYLWEVRGMGAARVCVPGRGTVALGASRAGAWCGSLQPALGALNPNPKGGGAPSTPPQPWRVHARQQTGRKQGLSKGVRLAMYAPCARSIGQQALWHCRAPPWRRRTQTTRRPGHVPSPCK